MNSKISGISKSFQGFHPLLRRLPITRDLSPSKDSDIVAFWWTSIREKPLKSHFQFMEHFKATKPRNWQFYPLTDGKLYES